MGTIVTNRNASDRMKLILPRIVEPSDIADQSWCADLWIHDPLYATLASDRVVSIANLAGGEALIAPVATANRPGMSVDVTLGKSVSTFDNDKVREYAAYSGTYPYTPATTLIVVFRGNWDGTNLNGLAGFYGAPAASRAALLIGQSGGVRAIYGITTLTDAMELPYVNNSWTAGFYFWNGSNSLAVRNGTVTSANITPTGAAPSGAGTFRHGSTTAARGFDGAMAMSLRLNVDLRDPAHLDKLNDVRAMILRYFGGQIVV